MHPGCISQRMPRADGIGREGMCAVCQGHTAPPLSTNCRAFGHLFGGQLCSITIHFPWNDKVPDGAGRFCCHAVCCLIRCGSPGAQDYNGGSGRSSPTGFQQRAPSGVGAASSSASRLSTTANDGNEEVHCSLRSSPFQCAEPSVGEYGLQAVTRASSCLFWCTN